MSEAHRFTGHDARSGHDTHGVPWAGRELPPTPFAGDTGEADPAVRGALRALGEVTGTYGADPATADTTRGVEEREVRAERVAAAEAALVAALATTRVFVPVVAEPASRTLVAGVAAHDRSDMASVVLTTPDGRRALPVFTGVEALAAWDPAARPVPVPAPDAARAAADDGCDTIVVDLGAADAVVLRLSHVWALAQGRPWRPPHADRGVLATTAALPSAVPGVLAAHACAGSGPGLLSLRLVLPPGLSGPEVDRIVAAAGEYLVRDPEVRVRIDGLSVTVRA